MDRGEGDSGAFRVTKEGLLDEQVAVEPNVVGPMRVLLVAFHHATLRHNPREAVGGRRFRHVSRFRVLSPPRSPENYK